MTTTTDPATAVRPIPGQTWKRKNGATHYLVLHVTEVEGFTYVLYRLTFDEPGQLVRCALLDEFTAEHEAPEWPVPPPAHGYSAVYANAGAVRVGLNRYKTSKGALEHADAGAVGVVKVTTTYEWVDADETGGE